MEWQLWQQGLQNSNGHLSKLAIKQCPYDTKTVQLNDSRVLRLPDCLSFRCKEGKLHVNSAYGNPAAWRVIPRLYSLATWPECAIAIEMRYANGQRRTHRTKRQLGDRRRKTSPKSCFELLRSKSLNSNMRGLVKNAVEGTIGAPNRI